MWLEANLNAFRPGRLQPQRLLIQHLEHVGGTSNTGDHYDNFAGFGTAWRSRLRRIMSGCNAVQACEERARTAWQLTNEKFQCSAARVFAHVHLLTRGVP